MKKKYLGYLILLLIPLLYGNLGSANPMVTCENLFYNKDSKTLESHCNAANNCHTSDSRNSVNKPLLESQPQKKFSFSLENREEVLRNGDLIEYKLIRVKKGDFLATEVIPNFSQDDIYIGFTPNHVYMLFNGKRFDGGLKLRGLPGKIRNSVLLNWGVIVGIKNVPEEIRKALIQQFSERDPSESFSCTSAICSLLSDSGIEVSPTNYLSPTLLLSNILKSGIKLQKDSVSLTTELYVAESATHLYPTLESHFNIAEYAETLPLIYSVGFFMLPFLQIMQNMLNPKFAPTSQ